EAEIAEKEQGALAGAADGIGQQRGGDQEDDILGHADRGHGTRRLVTVADSLIMPARGVPSRRCGPPPSLAADFRLFRTFYRGIGRLATSAPNEACGSEGLIPKARSLCRTQSRTAS